MDKHMQIKNKEAKRNASRGLELVSCSRARTRQLADLSEEMIMEILLRLPTRTLASLKSVCRLWRNLISTPDFTRNHLRRSCLRDPSLTPPGIAYFTHDGWYGGIEPFFVQSMLDNPSEPTKAARFSRGGYRIVGSCHGLLCFFDSDADDHMHAIVWNPCTGFIFESPQINGQAWFSGFGYDHLSDTYKFYATIRQKEPSGVEPSARIYTFGPTSSWRRIDDTPSCLLCARTAYDLCMADNLKGVFLSSSKACTINWCVYDVVVYFDLGIETYGRFTLPDRDSDGYHWTHCTPLYVLRDCLSVCYKHMKTQRWIVWQMKEYGEAKSWTTLATIPFHPQLCHPLQLLYISESDVLLVMSRSFKLVLCNLNDGSIDFSMIDSSSNGMEFCLYLSRYSSSRMAYIFHESLVSPNGLQSNSSKILLHFIKPKPKPKPNLSFTW